MELFITSLGCWTHEHGVVRFQAQPPTPRSKHQELRIFGNAEAVPYLLSLIGEHSNRIYVASPRNALKAVKETGIDRDAIIKLCQQARVPRSVGGWHRVDEKDVAHFSLVKDRRPFTSCTDSGSAWEHAHPLDDFFSFLQRTNPVDPQGFTDLAAEIIDPRWFIEPKRPHRRSAYLSFLGVCPAVLAGSEQSRRAKRCELLIATFLSGRGFLSDGYSDRADLKARLRVVRRTAMLLQDVWIAALATHPEMRCVSPLLAAFDEREYLQRAWQEATAG